MEQWQQDNRRDVVMVDIDQLVPKDHLLRKIEKVMDYDWLYERLSPYYCHGVGRDGTDPVVLIKMVLIQHLFGIPSLRQTYREIQLGSIEYTILEQPKEPTPAQEKPIRENPVQVNPTLVTPVQEEPAQLNKEESSNYPSRTDLSSTELSNPIRSNPPTPAEARMGTDRMGARECYREVILDNIEYSYLVQDSHIDREQLDEIVDLIVDTVCSARKVIRIAGDDYPAEVVKSRFMKLDSSHVQYVMDCMKDNTTYVRNIKKYLLVGLGEEDFASLSPELIQKYTEQFKTPERFMQINGNIVVLPVPAEKQDLAYLPDRFETGERVQTPRGSFQVTAMSREQMEAAGYGVHHISDDGKYLIMGNGTRAFAVAAEQPEKDNPLRTAEMTLEDDYGMIDGVINNGRRGEELEKAQEYAERITPEKPSIRERLEDAKRECAEHKPPEGKKPGRDVPEHDCL